MTNSSIIDYDGVSESGNLLSPIDHPNSHHLWITGTGLTHLGASDAMVGLHTKPHDDKLTTEAMKKYHNEVAHGKHKNDKVEVDPDWFYKGDGAMLVPPEKPLGLPDFALAGSEETEIVGIYLMNAHGVPHRLGFALGNEFTDPIKSQTKHAHSKILPCSIGPEILLGPLPAEVRGKVTISRDSKVVWQAQFLAGENHMAHSVENLEHAHFKHNIFRRPGDVHVHFLGSSVLSFSQGFRTKPGDVIEISAPDFGRPLRNAIEIVSTKEFDNVKKLH